MSSQKNPPFLVVLITGSAITAIALGARSTMGMFLGPVSDGLGLQTDSFALMIAIQNLVWGFGQPVAGGLADRFGARRVLMVGAVIYASGLVVLAKAIGPTGLHLGGGVLMGLGMSAASFSVVLAAIGRLVPESRRSFALGVATAFGSVGQFILIPISSVIIDSTSWETALIVLAGLALTITVICLPLRSSVEIGRAGVPNSPSVDTKPLREVLRQASRNRSYLLLNAGFFVCGFHVTFIGVHLPKHLEDLDQSSTVAAAALALIGLFNIAGSLTTGSLGQRHSKARLLSLVYGARSLVILGFIMLPNSPALSITFGCLMGLLWLSTIPLTSGIVMSQFGTQHAGTLFGIVFVSHQIGAFVSSWGAGIIRDSTGSYEVWWWVAVGMGIFAVLVHMFIDEGPAPPLVVVPPRPRVVIPASAAALWLLLGVATMTNLSHNGDRAIPGAFPCWLQHEEVSQPIAQTGNKTGATQTVLVPAQRTERYFRHGQ
ncbi:MAG: MFS transporter [Actinobacteria bacterium]|nr:MFS transporter [Actinomycetota bacterium]